MTKVEARPARPSLQFLKKQAKQQVAALRAQGRTASVAAAQLAIARQYGFASWRKLKAHVEKLNAASSVAGGEPGAAFDAVMKAIINRDHQALAQLLAAVPTIANLTGPHPRWGGRPQPLHVAIESGNRQAFTLLLNAGADLNGSNQGYDGWSPLMLAIRWKRAEMRDELLEGGANVDLVSALMLKDDRRVAKLLKNPAALQGPFPNDATPLHFARTVKSARLVLAKGVKSDAKDKYGKTAPQLWSEAQRPGLVRLASLGAKTPLDIHKAVEQDNLKQVRKLLAGGVDVNSRFPTGSKGTLLHNAAFNGDLALVKFLVAKGADLRALDQEHETTPAEWARFALNAFNRKSCEAVAQYLEDRMEGTKVAPERKHRIPEATLGSPQFHTIFPAVKARFDERPSGHGLVCKQGFYSDCNVLKLQKASWTNDRMDRVENETGIFFSIWTSAKDLNRVNYNIHALKLRQLKAYSITSRDFAEEFRDRFASVQDEWPHVSVKHGPLTLMQGWIEVTQNNAENEVLALMERFEQISPMIDRLLQARRR